MFIAHCANLSAVTCSPITQSQLWAVLQTHKNEVVYFGQPTITIFSQRLLNLKLAIFEHEDTIGIQYIHMKSCNGVRTRKLSFIHNLNKNFQQQSTNNTRVCIHSTHAQ